VAELVEVALAEGHSAKRDRDEADQDAKILLRRLDLTRPSIKQEDFGQQRGRNIDLVGAVRHSKHHDRRD